MITYEFKQERDDSITIDTFLGSASLIIGLSTYSLPLNDRSKNSLRSTYSNISILLLIYVWACKTERWIMMSK
jgi:hypothetical protein